MNEFWAAAAAVITTRISALFHHRTFKSLLFRTVRATSWKINLHFSPPLSSCCLLLLPCLITQSIKKAIKHHAGNMYNPLNKSWIKYANRNNGMLIGATLCLTYRFNGVRGQTFLPRNRVLPTFKVDWRVHRYSFKCGIIWTGEFHGVFFFFSTPKAAHSAGAWLLLSAGKPTGSLVVFIPPSGKYLKAKVSTLRHTPLWEKITLRRWINEGGNAFWENLG